MSKKAMASVPTEVPARILESMVLVRNTREVPLRSAIVLLSGSFGRPDLRALIDTAPAPAS